MGNIARNIKKKCSHVQNIVSMLQPNVLRTNDSSVYFYDSSNAVLNNNRILYNNLTSVAETNSSEKEINAEEQQKSGSNNCQSETLQIFENLNSTENVSEPDFDISNSVDTAQEFPLSNPQSSATYDVKTSKESMKYEIRFPDFYFSFVDNGWLCKIC